MVGVEGAETAFRKLPVADRGGSGGLGGIERALVAGRNSTNASIEESKVVVEEVDKSWMALVKAERRAVNECERNRLGKLVWSRVWVVESRVKS